MAHLARQQLEQREAAEAAAAEAGEGGLAQRPEVAVLVKADVQVRVTYSLSFGPSPILAPQVLTVYTLHTILPRAYMSGTIARLNDTCAREFPGGCRALRRR